MLLAGELGPYERSAEGCVGAMWSYLHRDMGVKGIQGCVFPLIPYKRRLTQEYQQEYRRRISHHVAPIFRRHRRLLEDVYDNAVSKLEVSHQK